MATIAVFIALGGASFAAMKLPKNSVGSKQIKKNAVTAAKIKDQAITGSKVKNGALTGTQINSSTLGIVPEATHAARAETAATLGGNGPDAFLHGNGSVIASRVVMDGGVGPEEPVVANLPGLGQINGKCTAGGLIGWGFRADTEGLVEIIYSENNNSPQFGLFSGEGGGVGSAGSSNFTASLQVVSHSDAPTFADIDLVGMKLSSSECSVSAQGLVTQ